LAADRILIFVHGSSYHGAGYHALASAVSLAGAAKVLAALEALASEPFLTGPELSLADLHVGAMIAYFTLAPEGTASLGKHPRLAAWWAELRQRASFAATDPGLPPSDQGSDRVTNA